MEETSGFEIVGRLSCTNNGGDYPDYLILSCQKHHRIGRSEDSDIVIPLPSISRNHCSIQIECGSADNTYRCYLRDQSSNGTFVNGLCVLKSSVPLEFGDVISFKTDKIELLEFKYYQETEISKPIGADAFPSQSMQKKRKWEHNDTFTTRDINSPLDESENSPQTSHVDKLMTYSLLDEINLQESTVADEEFARKLQEEFNKPILERDSSSCRRALEIQSFVVSESLLNPKDEDLLTAQAIQAAEEAELMSQERISAVEALLVAEQADIKEIEARNAEGKTIENQDNIFAMTLQREEHTMIYVNDLQRNVLLRTTSISKRASDDAVRPISRRCEALGIDNEDFQALLAYIRCDAPIIIHVRLEHCLDFFLKDTHYRNLFETGTSGGCTAIATRSQWEDRMFQRGYSGAEPAERVKYGVLNVSSDPSGVCTCVRYGDSYLLLRNERVRLRTTFADMDTSSASSVLGMVEHYAHVLIKFPDDELQKLVSIAKKETPWLPSKDFNRGGQYREAQIHGDVQFAEDVEALVVNSRHQKDTRMMAKIEEFCTRNSINYWFIE